MNQSGLLAWANSIRFTMASDPGRQLFADQIHTQGFMFLDNYLESILDGPKQEPELMIELVKTPGRNRTKQAKTANITSKLKHVTLSFQENITPNIGGNSQAAQTLSQPSMPVAYDIATLPEIPPWHPPTAHATEAFTAPLPTIMPSLDAPTDLSVQIHNPASPHEVTRKVSVPLFPTLPGPMALRKSTRIRDPSTGIALGPIGSATPAPVGGKRSSWLIKLREAKAMEEAGKKAIALVMAAPGTTIGMKRKSVDIFGNDKNGIIDEEEEERKYKMAKAFDGAPKAKYAEEKTPEDLSVGVRFLQQHQPTSQVPPQEQHQELAKLVSDPATPDFAGQDGMLDRLKRTVEDLGARVGKSMGKSLSGGAAASALAEARAAAEARVAQRERKRNEEEEGKTVVTQVAVVLKSKEKEVFDSPPIVRSSEGRLSVSDLVAPNSDVRGKKLSTVLQIPNAARIHSFENGTGGESTSTTPPNSPPPSRQESFKWPLDPVFSKPPPVFVPPPLPPVVNQPVQAATAGKSLLFNLPAPTFSMPSAMNLSTQISPKLSANPVWTFGSVAMGSTLPTGSQAAGAEQNGQDETLKVDSSHAGVALTVPGAFDEDSDEDYDEDYLGLDESEIEELEEAGKLTVSLVEPKADRTVSGSQSQLSLASSSSSHTGFLGQASKLVSSVLGTSKKGKTEVKSLQLAAVAAKKQQEEMDKKAGRLREMENRRQLALQRKAEEEKSKAMDQERKMKEDGERRKREREELTDKRPLKGAAKKEEDTTKKRKVFVEHNTSQPAAPFSSSKVATVPTTTKPTAKGKGKATVKNPDENLSEKQPSRVVQNQMAARVKAQIKAKQQSEPEIASENIELPEINSDFSDSEDEDQPKTFDPPDWAQSPELRQALRMQSTVNPDDIFGAIRPLKMEELFRTRTNRFRARTSSANWHGKDRLTAEEVMEYTRRMGFQ